MNKPCRVLGTALAFTALMAGLTACAPTRSVAAYCAAVKEHRSRYEQQMQGTTGISGLVRSVAAVGDLQTMWSDLADVAPDDIRTDTEAVRDAWSKTADDANEQKYIAAIAVALENANALQRVNAYIAEHCGVDAAPLGTVASGAALASPTPVASAAAAPGAAQVPVDDQRWDAVGDLLVSGGASDSDGAVQDGATVHLLDGAGAQTLRAATLLPGKDVTAARFTTARTPDGPVLVAVAQVRHPAKGLDPETFSVEVDAFDWSDLSLVHSSTLKTYDSEDFGFTHLDGSGSSAIALDLSDESTTKVLGIDPLTGRTLWHREGAIDGASVDTALVRSAGPGLDGNGQANCSVYSAIDIANGTAIVSVAENDYKDSGACVTLRPTITSGTYLASTPLKALLQIDSVYVGTKVHLAYDLHTGARLHPKGDVQDFDPITGQQWRDDDVNLSGPTHDAAIIDTTTGTKQFAVSEAHFAALDLQENAVYDGRLYTTTTDGTPVVDASDGSPISDSSSAYPIAPIAGSTLWSDGVVAPGRDRPEVLDTPTPTPTPTP